MSKVKVLIYLAAVSNVRGLVPLGMYRIKRSTTAIENPQLSSVVRNHFHSKFHRLPISSHKKDKVAIQSEAMEEVIFEVRADDPHKISKQKKKEKKENEHLMMDPAVAEAETTTEQEVAEHNKIVKKKKHKNKKHKKRNHNLDVVEDTEEKFDQELKHASKPIPSSSAYFRDIRERGFVYVDKTKEILENFVSISSGMYHFLARPRRFGKSLLCFTIAELFQGDAKLFEGLYIYDKWDFLAEKRPVIHIQMDLFRSDNANEFTIKISDFLRELAAQNDFSLTSRDCPMNTLLRELVTNLHHKHGKRVVVIIDEYDTPLHNCMNRPEELEVMRNVLSKLYGVLKPLEQHLRLVYLTGILKFSNLSLFSELNNIKDHSFRINLSGICGFSREELETNFGSHLHRFAADVDMSYDELLSELTTQFNGYCFAVNTHRPGRLPPTVFNPFAINRAIEDHTFKDTWIESGHSGQLVSLIVKNRAGGKALENLAISLEDLDSISTPSELSYQCLMYYAGYSTIRGYNHETGMVTLAAPTDSIGQNVMKVIAQTIFKVSVDKKDLELARELVNEIFSTEYDEGQQVKALERILNDVVLLFPWQLLKTSKALESTYNVMLTSFLRLGCLDHTYIGNEVSVSTGDMECAIESKDKAVVAILEYKLCNSALVAMNQMKRNRFAADRFQDKAVIFVAINITKDRTVQVLIERTAGR